MLRFLRFSFIRSLVFFSKSGNLKEILLTKRNILVVAPHPDDETFGCGGLISMLIQNGNDVSIIVLSKGEMSHHGCCKTPKEEIANARQRCLLKAGKALGLSSEDIYLLDFPDGEIDSADDHSKANLLNALIDNRPDVVLLPVPFDGWADHERATLMVEGLLAEKSIQCKLLYYPVWMWHIQSFIEVFHQLKKWNVIGLNISSALVKKKKAINCYLEEQNPRCGAPWCGRLPKGFPSYFARNREFFFEKRR